MLKDVTIGQYYPTGSVIHKLDPRTKILFTTAFVVMLFFLNNLWGYLATFLILVTVTLLSKIPIGYILRGVKGLVLIIMLTVVLNLFMTPGNVVASLGPLKITIEGLKVSTYMALRLIFLVIGTSIMTLTTSPIDLTDGMEWCMRFIPFVRRYAHELAMMMSIALRFIPTLMEETDRIMKAQKARGANFETGNIIARAKNLIPILIPLFISAFRRADELATAMEARCYRGGENRTRMKQLAYCNRDWVSFLLMLIMIVGLFGTTMIQIPLLFPV
ncbi:energy-coupling factor transporter transmembrane component T family protein [Acetobacterium woodii]|uniref:Cobalt ABC transport system permease protein CbiQ3 n=1 Tax=Acetobacterium woodii (strain ATCC 29683 / DSM 1030 / JCM 2381 / KCTC 1655 / WB1) TaxID=931626 RepID=H6LGR9_ACEWD|nr:energy-coupling factor transporter transmembrane component T [Acetobacterium woodii]AFA49583.1 cobalt ABC transport system permease protein CbiQ3 [Acetobacterium woodii DSM 1030]